MFVFIKPGKTSMRKFHLLFFLLGTCQNSSTIVDFSLFRMQNLTTVLKTAACLDVKTTLGDWQDGEFQNAYFISVDIISVCGSRMKGELVFEKLRHYFCLLFNPFNM